ncbi:HesB/IscA family protein [Gimibacter soli]|uniref:Iron-sulfur cluster assembly accessory protein n=1 Tax=Gimibacter soli TaxID=3024400 RepID=A0AAF0BHZ3_9PROT|nr:iron-sulfur cluster assembly accessory protein [Gimibacter soli]WCL54778.1 iron-sulfur cluster assembly accessory protein [Gimibacter soli]
MSVIEITDKAAERIKALLENRPEAIGLKLGTDTKGCSGLGYKIDYVTEADPADEKVEANGVAVFVDRKSLLYLLGTRMDWEESRFSTGFTFTNPNEKGRCGCGESFHI